MSEEPWPKRRRREEGRAGDEAVAPAIPASAITGQRQNRWMQDWVPVVHVPSTTDGEAAYSSPRQTPGVVAHVNGGRKERGVSTTSSRGSHDRGGHMSGNHVAGIPGEEGAIQRTFNPPAGHGVVQYESPANDPCMRRPYPVANTVLVPPDVMAYSAANPGLPSPALSDENTTSPVTSAGALLANPMPPRVRNSRQSTTPYAGLAHSYTRPPPGSLGLPSQSAHPRSGAHPQARTHSPAHSHTHSPAQPQAQPLRSSSMGSSAQSCRTLSHSSLTTQVPSNSHGSVRRADSHHSITPAIQPSRPVQDSTLSTAAMQQRLKSFKPDCQLNTVDSGRMTLLREAVEKSDIFYIVLSQIHALKATPHLVPKTAQILQPESFTVLEHLLCANELATACVLEYLADFPAPIQDIYFNPQLAAIYEPHVVNVTRFLWNLPTNWNRLIQECKKRLAPPLTHELYYSLQLPSAVFQTTAFRAIARLVIEQKHFKAPDLLTDKYETLHKIDQYLFYQGQRRNESETAKAYQALSEMRGAWRAYEEDTSRHEQVQRQVPAGQQRPSPEFVFPRSVVDAFQLRSVVANTPQLPTQPSQQQQYATSPSTQGAVLTHARRIAPANAVTALPHTDLQRRQFDQWQQRGDPVQVMQLIAPNLLFPSEREQPRAQPTNPDPLRSALHQAHLRSPKAVQAPLRPDEKSSGLYRYVEGFALPPRKLRKDMPVQNIVFNIPPEDFDRIPNRTVSRVGEPGTRVLTEKSQMFRLRCASYPVGGFPSESSWIISDNYWPENLFLECNSVILEPRRKLQHGRYLPIDLTPHVKAGDNTITAIVNRTSTDPRPFECALAVETVGVMSEFSLKTKIQRLEAAESLSAIKSSLSGSTADEEISVTSSCMTIKLFDPYSGSKIFDIPVRGTSCVHRDCFDLQTFLSLCKREGAKRPTVIDCWRCPLCRGDVRPHTLVVDEFLVDIRQQLEQRGLLNTRAIVVEADGNWKPKAEERTGVRSPSLETEKGWGASDAAPAATGAARKVLEVVEID